MDELKLLATGQKLKVLLVLAEEDTLQDALSKVDPRLRTQAQAKVYGLLKKLAQEGNLRMPEFFNKEDVLPDGAHFFAVKTNSKLRLRAYGWFSGKHKGSFIVSHYAFKKGEKLEARDTARVIANWRSIER